jgi:N-acetyl-anhydromuramyl-L-alanine amidase AmpD
MTVTIETTPAYQNLLGQNVYMIRGAPVVPRTEKDVLVLMLHHTAGTDSRSYGADNPRGVSYTYLTGAYPDTGNVPRVYKYFSETNAAPQAQGGGKLGGLPYNLNTHSITIEVEGLGGAVPFRADVLDCAAKLAASIIKDWHDRVGRNLVLLGHDHTDLWTRPGRHSDPHFDWSRFAQQVYAFVGGLQGNVKGWGR